MSKVKSPAGAASNLSRREFVKRTALATGALAFAAPCIVRGRNLNDKINIAVIGAAGKGASDTDCCASENIVALCDADANYCAEQRKKYPDAKFHHDFRKMFDQMHKSIDAVIVATPDHVHAVAASRAIKLGKHVYCQKPLTQTIYEARYLRDLAAKEKVVTQMGNQGSAEDGLRRAVECIQAGIIGPVRRVYLWSNRPLWPQGMDRPSGQEPVPRGLDWDVWLGPAPMRPFVHDEPDNDALESDRRTAPARRSQKGIYHPLNWRGWQDFGTGALGDMACHTANLPFRALKLGYPTEVEAESSGMNKETYPLASKIRFGFPAREGLPALTFWWYDGGKPKPNHPYRHDGSNKPPKDTTTDIEAMRGDVPGSGCLLIGDQGRVFSPDDYGANFFLKLKDDTEFKPAKTHEAVAAIPQVIPRNPHEGDAERRHHLEWLAAIREGKPEMCYSRFGIAAYLTEIILLGCVALRVGRKLEWNGPKMKAQNAPEAAQYIRREHRKGWKLA